MNALMRFLGPLSARTSLPAGPDDEHQAFKVDILALRMATVTRPQWSGPELLLIKGRSE